MKLNIPIASISFILAYSVFASSLTAQEVDEPIDHSKVQGKVARMLPSSKTAEVAPRIPNLRRLVSTEEDHQKLLAQLSKPLTEDQQEAEYQRRLARYDMGAYRSQQSAAETPYSYGPRALVREPKAKPADLEISEEGSNGLEILIGAILVGGFMIRQLRK